MTGNPRDFRITAELSEPGQRLGRKRTISMIVLPRRGSAAAGRPSGELAAALPESGSGINPSWGVAGICSFTVESAQRQKGHSGWRPGSGLNRWGHRDWPPYRNENVSNWDKPRLLEFSRKDVLLAAAGKLYESRNSSCSRARPKPSLSSDSLPVRNEADQIMIRLGNCRAAEAREVPKTDPARSHRGGRSATAALPVS